tara:strand:- start:1782 stop:1958 length:177 start_codon:yes stop_codon:yes gene_type:complete
MRNESESKKGVKWKVVRSRNVLKYRLFSSVSRFVLDGAVGIDGKEGVLVRVVGASPWE